MNTVQRIARNTTVMLVSQVASYLLAFFYMMYTARYLGPESFGILSFALAFTTIFSVLADFGFQTLTVREVARDKSLAQKYLSNVGLMKIFLAVITFGLIALTINLMGYPEETINVVYLLALYIILQSFIKMFYAIFQAFEKMEFQGIGQILNSALILTGVFFAIKYNLSVVGFAYAFVIASIVVLAYTVVVILFRFIKPHFKSATKLIEFDWNFWKPALKKSAVFAIGGIFATLYYMIDRVMLSAMKGDIDVGYYSAAYNLINSLSFIPHALAFALFPIMSNYFRTSQNSLRKIYQHSARYMFMLALPIAVGTILLSRRIILIIYGADFLPFSAEVLNILIWSELLIFTTVIMSYMLVSINKEKITLLNAVVGAVLNIVLNLILIPSMGINGAAIATVVSDIYFFFASAYFLSRYGYKLNFFKIIPIPLITSALMGIAIYYLDKTSLYLLIPISVIMYFAVLFITRYISKEDIRLLKQVVTKGIASK